jgi:transposase
MRPAGTPEQLEQRRRRAIAQVKAGHTLSTVARQFSASVSSVHRWWQAYTRAGVRGLRPKPIPGRPSRLSAVQKQRLVTLLGRGPLRAGYRTDLWALPRVAGVIREHFGVRYHPAHVWKLLTGLGWSCQKPERRAVERDEPAIARWKRTAWPRIKKRRSPGGPPRVR